MIWNEISSIDDVESIRQLSHTKYCIIFKHSTRCSISTMTLSKFERHWNEDSDIQPYLLNLLQHRDVSTYIADAFNIQHESPQVLLIKNGECIYSESHNAIRFDEILDNISEN